MKRWSSVDRVRAVTAGIAGGLMALAVVALVAADGILVLGILPGTAPLLIVATTIVAAWRAEEAVATRSPLGWAWGSSWRSLLVGAIGVGIIMGVIFGQAVIGQPLPPAPSSPEQGGFQIGIIASLVYAPVPLLLGMVVHLCAALAVRRAVRRWWSWFAA